MTLEDQKKQLAAKEAELKKLDAYMTNPDTFTDTPEYKTKMAERDTLRDEIKDLKAAIEQGEKKAKIDAFDERVNQSYFAKLTAKGMNMGDQKTAQELFELQKQVQNEVLAQHGGQLNDANLEAVMETLTTRIVEEHKKAAKKPSKNKGKKDKDGDPADPEADPAAPPATPADLPDPDDVAAGSGGAPLDSEDKILAALPQSGDDMLSPTSRMPIDIWADPEKLKKFAPTLFDMGDKMAKDGEFAS